MTLAVERDVKQKIKLINLGGGGRGGGGGGGGGGRGSKVSK